MQTQNGITSFNLNKSFSSSVNVVSFTFVFSALISEKLNSVKISVGWFNEFALVTIPINKKMVTKKNRIFMFLFLVFKATQN